MLLTFMTCRGYGNHDFGNNLDDCTYQCGQAFCGWDGYGGVGAGDLFGCGARAYRDLKDGNHRVSELIYSVICSTGALVRDGIGPSMQSLHCTPIASYGPLASHSNMSRGRGFIELPDFTGRLRCPPRTLPPSP